MHMFGNLKLLIDFAEFDEYAHALRYFLYPILPPFFFLWVFRISLIVAVVAHIASAAKLTMAHYDATGRARYVKRRYQQGRFAARTMIWGGIIIATFLIFHLLQFTAQVITVGYTDSAPPHARVVMGFSHPACATTGACVCRRARFREACPPVEQWTTVRPSRTSANGAAPATGGQSARWGSTKNDSK